MSRTLRQASHYRRTHHAASSGERRVIAGGTTPRTDDLDTWLRRHFAQLMGDGETKGAQIYVSQSAGEVLHASYGRHDFALSTHSVTRWFCASKPLTATVAAGLVQSGRLSWDSDFMEILGVSGPSIGVGDLMRHRVCFGDVPSLETLSTAATLSEVAQIVLRARPPVLLPERETRYSSSAWMVLAAVLETITDDSIANLVERGPLRNLPHRPVLVIRDESPEPVVPPLMWSDGRLVPVRFLVRRALVSRSDPASGGFGTPRALAAFYERLAGFGSSPPLVEASTLSAMLQSGPKRFDRHFDRECSFGTGFMCGMQDFGCGSFSPRSFGHTGWPGVYAVVEPELEAVVVLILHGVPHTYMSSHSGIGRELNPALEAVVRHLGCRKRPTRQLVRS